MAIIDTFLKLMVERRAERLVLVSDRVPILLMDGEMIELSMPALREDMLRRISRDMIGEEERYEGNFRAANGVEFGYRVHPCGTEWRVEIHTLGAVPREDPGAKDPLTRAVDGFIKSSSAPADMDAVAVEPSPDWPDPELVALLDSALLQNASPTSTTCRSPPTSPMRLSITSRPACSVSAPSPQPCNRPLPANESDAEWYHLETQLAASRATAKNHPEALVAEMTAA